MMEWKRFTKDNLRRTMQKNWNTTQFPLYGGTILRPIHRRTLIEGAEFDHDAVRIETIPNPIEETFNEYNKNADD